MKRKFKPNLKYAKSLFTTGSFTETSRNVEIEITKHIPPNKDVVIVEYGMGQGNLTKEILNNISENSKLYSFEIKESFCVQMKEEINDDRLIIINDSAENVKKHLKENIHLVVSSIPFSFFSKEKGLKIIQDSYDLLHPECFYSQVLYSKLNYKKFTAIFDKCSFKRYSNFPTEYIYHCQKL